MPLACAAPLAVTTLSTLVEEEEELTEGPDELEPLIVLVTLRFQSHADKQRLRDLLFSLERVCALGTVCAVLMFWSSVPWQGAISQLDAVLTVADVAAVDLSSAAFMLAGALGAMLVRAAERDNAPLADSAPPAPHADPAPRAEIITRALRCLQSVPRWRASCTAALFLCDVWLDSLLSGLAAVLLAVALESTYGDAAIKPGAAPVCASVLEAVTMLHAADTTPLGTFHGANPSAWLVRTLAWCVLTLPLGLAGAESVRARFGVAGLRALLISDIAAVVLLASFGRLALHRSVLYASLHSLFYRSLEFSVGVHIEALCTAEDNTLAMCLRVLATVSEKLLLVIACAWSTHVGRTYAAAGQALCPRMYAFANCLPHFWPLPLPGIALGAVLVADSWHTHQCVGSVGRLRRCLTAVFFAWPMCQAVRLAAAINFAPGAARGSEALLAFLSMAALALLVPAYQTLKTPLRLALYNLTLRASCGQCPTVVRFQFVSEGDLGMTEYEEHSPH